MPCQSGVLITLGCRLIVGLLSEKALGHSLESLDLYPNDGPPL